MMRRTVAVFFMLSATSIVALAQPPGRRAESPAATPIPETLNPQTYSPELVAAGEATFGAQCGFCHGRDAAGGAGGADLTRSEIVARDVRGDLIGPVIRNGRLETGMPAFAAMAEDDVDAIVAFIHTQKTLAESLEGGRRGVSEEDLLTGDVAAGRRYFEAECSACHSASGDLEGIAGRMQGLRLLQRMLYPRPGNLDGSVRGQTRVTVNTPEGDSYLGVLQYQDEFSIALTDAAGNYRSFSTRRVSFEIDNPLDGHLELLGRYTDEDMHDVITYLHTLR
jgi:cytochrome c oxidase cbb3-type subunit 3